jgi:hypothetical protein
MRTLVAAALGLLVLPSWAFADTMVVDRGLPTTNLNNAAGNNRSNVGWADTPAYDFYGDTFTLPSGGGGAVYAVHTIRTWIASFSDPSSLYSLATLFTGIGTSTLSATATNPTITLSSYTGGVGYQRTSGPVINVYEVDFTGLNLIANGGTTISFGVEGVSAGPIASDNSNLWYNLASNAALSGSPQDSADGLLQEYSWDGVNPPAYLAAVDSNQPNFWDKSSDINVQVFADVPEPASMSLLAAGALGLGFVQLRRRR